MNPSVILPKRNDWEPEWLRNTFKLRKLCDKYTKNICTIRLNQKCQIVEIYGRDVSDQNLFYQPKERFSPRYPYFTVSAVQQEYKGTTYYQVDQFNMEYYTEDEINALRKKRDDRQALIDAGLIETK